MGATIPAAIMGYQGQVIEQVEHDENAGKVRIFCRRDRRVKPIAAGAGRGGGINRLKKRWVSDLPIAGQACQVEVEYAEVFISPSVVRVEQLPFVDSGMRVTKRYALLISGLCRHMPISAVARHTGLRWNTVKSIDKAYLAQTIRPVPPQSLEGIRHLGVDEVARAKGQHYLTLVYDLSPGEHCGRILWIKEGRTSAVFSELCHLVWQPEDFKIPLWRWCEGRLLHPSPEPSTRGKLRYSCFRQVSICGLRWRYELRK